MVNMDAVNVAAGVVCVVCALSCIAFIFSLLIDELFGSVR